MDNIIEIYIFAYFIIVAPRTTTFIIYNTS